MEPIKFHNVSLLQISKVHPAGMSSCPWVGPLGPPWALGVHVKFFSPESDILNLSYQWLWGVRGWCEKKLLLVASMGYLSIKILTNKFSKIPKFSLQKWVECEMKKKIKTLSAHRFLKVELVPQFRKLLNVWHIQNLEQPFLIWACNCLVKFWRSPKNFKIQKFLWKIRNHLSKKNSPQKILDFEIFWTSSKFDEAIAGPNQKRLLQILDMSYI